MESKFTFNLREDEAIKMLLKSEKNNRCSLIVLFPRNSDANATMQSLEDVRKSVNPFTMPVSTGIIFSTVMPLLPKVVLTANDPTTPHPAPPTTKKERPTFTAVSKEAVSPKPSEESSKKPTTEHKRKASSPEKVKPTKKAKPVAKKPRHGGLRYRKYNDDQPNIDRGFSQVEACEEDPFFSDDEKHVESGKSRKTRLSNGVMDWSKN